MQNRTKFDLLRSAAEISYPSVTGLGNIGAWTYDTWAEHNERYFDGLLEPCAIIWGLTPHGHLLGSYDAWLKRITLHTSLIEPKFDELNASRGKQVWGHEQGLFGAAYASDVLLHEMIHQKIHQLHGHNGIEEGGNSSHNNPLWVAEINRLAPLLGLTCHAEVIRQKRIEKKVQWYTPPGVMTRSDLGQFPHCLRPAGYYHVNSQPSRALI